MTTISLRSRPGLSERATGAGMPLNASQVQGVAIVTALVILAIGFLGFIHPAMKQRSADAATAANLRTQAQQQDAAAAQLRSSGTDAASLAKIAAAFTKAFPADYQQETWLNSINAAAAAAHVSLDRLDVEAPKILSDPDADTSVEPATTGGSSTTPSTSSASTSTSADATTATTPDTTAATAPVTGSAPPAGTIAQSAVTLTATGEPGDVIAFVGSLENGTRPLVLSSYGYNVDPKSGKATASIGGDIYLADLPTTTATSTTR